MAAMAAALALVAADSVAYECVLLRDQQAAAIDRLKRDAVANGGYVFAFRHSNKLEIGSGLTDDGLAEARKASSFLADLLRAPDGGRRTGKVKIFELAPYASRIAETRAAFLPGFAATGVDTKDIPHWLAADWSRLASRDETNIFLFGNQAMLESLTCAKEPCDFGCLEGAVLKPARDGTIALCYRLYPAEWAEPRTDDVPAWTYDKAADVSGFCAGAR